MELFKNSSKQSLSLQNRGHSSTAHPTPLAGKGKQIVQGRGEVFTHFISFPLAIYPELKKKVDAFRNSILGNNNDNKQRTLAEKGIEESMFVSPNTFHLTVVMLKLENEKDVDAALAILKDKSFSASVMHALDNRPVFVRLKGLESMNGSLDKTRVLYAPVEEVGDEGRLLRACHVIIDAFVNAKFAAENAKSRLKLHATMMNASYRRDKSKGMTFDAREIHKEFGEINWGEYLIREAQLSKRSWYDSSGYYHCCGSLPFPLE
ncbi:hypothetical protein EUTSA_v10021339mg [Eutrema salsugineum]|uniref:A-kinase anchor protein 7-like phosphoesterase domain-containing protein n=1 Tax=Eutrema salsugineum TaxID=72664 RepID=V4M7H4_EUTSA|nr:uncharacterized protein LOC18024385 isoform X2 [Eutrema salsugineum]ESQ48313.1 hypothetical protein EUTSA_v10021339mg [Eutrema salsugineum]